MSGDTSDESEYIEVLGRKVRRSEWEEDENIVYLTYQQMLTLVTSVTQLEQGRRVEIESDSAVMRVLNEIKRSLWTEIQEKLGDEE